MAQTREQLSANGRKGGLKIRDEYGREFYQEIGRKGGRKCAQYYGPMFYEEIGAKGRAVQRNRIGLAKAAADAGFTAPDEMTNVLTRARAINDAAVNAVGQHLSPDDLSALLTLGKLAHDAGFTPGDFS